MKRITVLLTAIALAGLAIAPSAFASRSQISIFDGGGELLSDATRESTLDRIQALGARDVRVLITWQYAVPSSNSTKKPNLNASNPNSGLYDWGAWDRLVASLRQRRMNIHMVISGPVPRWASRPKRDNATNPSPALYRQFATAVARRYRRFNPKTWSTWNEPNQNFFLRPQFRRGRPASPKMYRNLHIAAVKGLRQGGVRRPKLLLGDLAGRSRNNVAPLLFLREMLCVDSRYRRKGRCGKLTFAGMAIHTYSARLGPFQRPPKRDDVLINALPRLTNALDRLGRAGRINRRLSVWVTESGTVTKPRADGTSLTKQPIFTGTMERIAYENPRVRAFAQYLMRDPAADGGAGTFTTGLIRSNGQEKPSYDGWRLPVSARRSGSRVSLWGLVRPTRRRTSVTVEYCDRRCTRSNATWRRLFNRRTNPRGYWTGTTRYRRGRNYRTTWRSGGERFTGPPVTPLVWRQPVR